MLNRAVIVAALAALPALAFAQEEPPADPTPAPAGVAVAPAGDATADAPVKKKRKRARAAPADFRVGSWRGTVDAEAEVVGGALSGRSTLRERGGVVEAGADVEPALERGRWRLALPVALAHRETPGATQRETRGGLAIDARYKTGPRFRLDLDGGLKFAHRPDWLDEYQPTATGLGTTDRYSHLDLHVGGAVTVLPARHQHVRIALGYTDLDYADDPDYDAIDAPTHLVPGDRGELDLDASWRWFGDGWKAGAAVAFEDQHDDANYARDAGDGQTHAGAGGPPPNPLYHELDVEPSVGAELDLAGGDLELGADVGYAIVSDRYQGYYSRRGVHPEVHARYQGERLGLKLSAEALFATYGDGSYASDGTPERPALESGTRRADRRLAARASVRYQLGGHLAIVGGAEAVRRDTNFPDYVPNVFPASRAYDVRWDYTTWELTAGLSASR